MCHELAHCVHGDHDKAFFKLMREIQREHARVVQRIPLRGRRGGIGSTNKSKKNNVKKRNRKKGATAGRSYQTKRFIPLDGASFLSFTNAVKARNATGAIDRRTSKESLQ